MASAAVPSKIMPSAAVRSKGVVLLLLIQFVVVWKASGRSVLPHFANILL